MAVDTELFMAAHGIKKTEGKSIFIPKGSTNGDVIKLIFPEAKIIEIRDAF